MINENDSEKSNSSGNNKVAETINAVTGLTQSVPIYQDAFQPAAKAIGKGLETIVKSINVALAPLSAMVWGYEKIQEQFIPKVTEKLKDTKPEDIITPKPNVAVPAIEALRYTAYDESLSDLFAGLLASAMDKNKSNEAHPGFVEIIKQLTSDEAKIISKFKVESQFILIDLLVCRDKKYGGGEAIHAGNISEFYFSDELECPYLSPSYLVNICRLGLAEIPYDTYATDNESQYKQLKSIDHIVNLKNQYELKQGERFFLSEGLIRLTKMGEQFIFVCVS
ncbi:DUF4393 domain-containing protein [Pectobacterium carotovorum]|uniref:DUF4393 domain-containing protein n=1 Tax=Pectobacterium carotovorum TaxID=554 RepID=UPI0005807F60|nr:DUF4393 domain-containing protein [Pectobacterium carotovorum]KHT18063.1 hypothetical protein RC96_10935 [Pectobacterium carotovorum subsp. carotovorum]